MVKNAIVLVTGGFDPIHSGHIEYLKEAKKLGDVLYVGINSDAWLTHKKGRPFLNYSERRIIVEALAVVDNVIEFNDEDGTACDAIERILRDTDLDVIFANGGDRNNETTLEYLKYKKNPRVEFVFGVGGENKKNSSSWILNDFKASKTHRNWGYYRVLHSDGPSTKVKELVVDPGKSLSLQRHKHRSEHWIITSGIASVRTGYEPDWLVKKYLAKHQEIDIPVGRWHQLCNETNEPLKIVEIQHGTVCIEEDIERI